MSASGMTKSDRDALARAVRARFRVLRAELEQRKAEALADFEQQVAKRYDFGDERWKALTQRAAEACDAANEAIRAAFEAEAVPVELAPSASVTWWNRGENAVPSRRAELRKVALSRLDAQHRAAKVAVDRLEAENIVQLIAGGLDTASARDFLGSIPSALALVPGADLAQIEAETAK